MNKIFKNKKIISTFLLIFISTFVASLFSFDLLLEKKNSEYFLPFFNPLFDNNDQYFYYTILNDFKNNFFVSNFPHDLKSKEISIHYLTYFFNFLFSSFFYFIFDNTKDMFLFNKVFFIFLNFFLAYKFTKLFEANKIKIYIICLLVFLMPSPTEIHVWFEKLILLLDLNNSYDYLDNLNYVTRYPNIQSTGFFLILFIIILFKNLYKNYFKNKFLYFLFFPLLFSSIFILVHNFIFFFGLMIYCKIIHLLNEKKINFNFVLGIIVFIIIVFYIGLFFLLPERIGFLKINYNIKQTFFYFIFIITNYFLTLLNKNSETTFLIRSIIFSNFLAFLIYLPFGLEFYERFYYKGSFFVIDICFYILLFNFIDNFLKKYFRKISIKHLYFSIIFYLILYIPFLFFNKINVYERKEIIKNDYQLIHFHNLSNWLNKNTRKGSYFATLDFNLNMNLPAYTIVKPYIKQKYLSSESVEIKIIKILKISNILNIYPADLISQLMLNGNIDYFNLYLYGYEVGEPNFEKDKFIYDLEKNLYNKSLKIDNFNYLIINKKHNFIINNWNLIYDNPLYSIYVKKIY